MKLLLLSLLSLFTCSCFAADSSIAEVFNKRFSGRSYDATKPVTQTQLNLLAEAARSTPSSYNEQPWRFIFCDRATNPEAYNKAFSTLVEFNQNWVKGAPVLVIIVASTKSSHNEKRNSHAEYDTGAAAFAMMMQATYEGLMTHQMGGFDVEKLRKEFAIPADFIPLAVMTVGYPSASEKAPEKKDRLPLQNNFFSGSWSKGL